MHEFRAVYPTRFIAAVAILPFASGESPLQHYNTVLCADVLQRDADIVLTFSNERALQLSSSLPTSSAGGSTKAAPSSAPASSAASFRRSANGGDRGGTGSSRGASTQEKGKGKATVAGVGMDYLNFGIGEAIAGALLPATDDSGRNRAGKRGDLWDLCAAVCPAPTWKFVEVHHAAHSAAGHAVVPNLKLALQKAKATATVPKKKKQAPPSSTLLSSARRDGSSSSSSSSSSFNGISSAFQAAGNSLVEAMLDNIPIYTRPTAYHANPSADADAHHYQHPRRQRPIQTIASQLIFRGGCGPRTDAESAKLAAKLRKTLRAPSWSPFPCDLRHDIGTAASAWGSATLVANRTSVADPLQHALTRAREMFEVKAFWHWYQQCGMEEGAMLAAFENVGCVVEAYSTV